MDGLSESQCSSSGCESGWTMYLDQSSWSNKNHHNPYEARGEKDGEEREDSSMVSDASSGPPHYIVDDDDDEDEEEEADDCFGHQVTNIKKKSNEYCNYNRGQNYYTASSLALGNKSARNDASKKQVQGISQEFTGKKTKGKSALKKHFGFLQPSFRENSASKEPNGFQGRKWK